MTEKKELNPIIGNVIVAVGTSVILGILGFFMGVFEKGAAAINEDQIETVVERMLDERLKTDSGVTMSQALVQINTTLVRIENTGNINREDIRDIRDALTVLASQ